MLLIKLNHRISNTLVILSDRECRESYPTQLARTMATCLFVLLISIIFSKGPHDFSLCILCGYIFLDGVPKPTSTLRSSCRCSIMLASSSKNSAAASGILLLLLLTSSSNDTTLQHATQCKVTLRKDIPFSPSMRRLVQNQFNLFFIKLQQMWSTFLRHLEYDSKRYEHVIKHTGIHPYQALTLDLTPSLKA